MTDLSLQSQARPPKDRLPGIQALRGLAALAVVVRHALTETADFGWVSLMGGAGVDIFFVISGFVMAYTSDGMSARTFLARRLARIVPIYWLCTLFLVAVAASGVAYQSQNISPSHVFASLLFFDPNPVLFVGWSLNYEIFFYLLFAATLALGLARWTVVVIPLLMLASVASGLPGVSRPIVLEFAFGVVLGWAYMRGLSGRLALPAAALAAALFVLTSVIGAQSPTKVLSEDVRWLWWGGPALLTVYASLYWKPRWTLLGDASYSVYLVQVFVMTLMAKALLYPATPVWLAIVLAVVFSLVLGVVVHLTVEKPMHRWVNGYLRNRPPAVAAPTPSRT